jgi:hypothetical protein
MAAFGSMAVGAFGAPARPGGGNGAVVDVSDEQAAARSTIAREAERKSMGFL